MKPYLEATNLNLSSVGSLELSPSLEDILDKGRNLLAQKRHQKHLKLNKRYHVNEAEMPR
jgi:hypothetical protein